MKSKRWILGLVLAAAVGLFGLMEAGASPFSSQVLSDDLGNVVNGKAPKLFDNAGHGNNEDGYDSDNKGQGSEKGQGGPNDGEDASCDGSGECVDDEMEKGSKGQGNKK